MCFSRFIKTVSVCVCGLFAYGVCNCSHTRYKLRDLNFLLVSVDSKAQSLGVRTGWVTTSLARLCHDYRLCVLCEAMSYASSLPAIFYLDSLRCAAASLLHKDVHVTSSGYESRMRPWFCGVGDPGTGKSHAADPHLAIVEEVCQEHHAYAPGKSDAISTLSPHENMSVFVRFRPSG